MSSEETPVKRGRKATTVEHPELPVIAEDSATAMIETAEDLGVGITMVLGYEDTLKRLGAIEALEYVRRVGDKATAEIFTALQKTRAYIGLPYKGADGIVRRVGTFDEFCEVKLGKSYSRCQELAKNLHMLGPELYEQTESLGLRNKDYRAINALPADDREIVKKAIEETNNREEVIDLIQEMAARHFGEKEAANKKVADLEADLAAKQSRLERDAARINSLEDENARLTSIPKTPAMIEEEQIGNVLAQSQLVVREIEAGLRGQLAKLERLFDDGVLPNHVRLAQQQAVTQILQAARVLAGDFGITLKLEDQEPQQLLWLKNAETMFGDTAPPADDADDLLPPDGE